jgi:D-sedoheptulose 7-phosphate isomerase
MKREMNVHHHNGSRNGTTGSNARIVNARDYFEIHGAVTGRLPYTQIDQIGEELWRAYQEQRKVFLFGNGGNAALACHFACDLGKGTVFPETNHRRFQVLSLTNNVSLLTALANDLGYEDIFAEQLRSHGGPGDIAFGLSASGNSPNILRALEVSRELGGINIGLTGFQGGKMKALCDYCVVIPSDNMQIIEDLQLSVAHALFTCLRERMQNPAAMRAQAAEAS